MQKRVFVGLSGGVDSAVSAALLKRAGHKVTGVFIKIWRPEFLECTWREDRLDAMRVCAALDIPLRELDLSAQYKRDVIDPMLRDYARGITPNPDVLCNRSIKFGAFARWAREQGADAVATGHYARVKDDGARRALLRARDRGKDQSYFLYLLEQDDLAHAIFPVGDLRKSEVRELASRYGLPVAHKPDSQGLCFVGEVTMREFLSRFVVAEPGALIDETGRRVGSHLGAMFYTIGQRHGFTADAEGSPLYVTRIDIADNTVHVSKRREDAARSTVTIEQVHWIGAKPAMPKRMLTQARYHEEPAVAKIAPEGNAILARFDEPHLVSPGQSLVFYESDVCLGGGIIASE